MQTNRFDYPPKRWQQRYGLLATIWSALVIGSLVLDIGQEKQSTLRTATAAARANINKDISFRKWASSHGGVYVPPTGHTPPNPYLKLPDRDVVTTTGKALTLMNPAYVLREMQTDFPGDFGFKSHITSLKLLNPNNAPDAWEAKALHGFEQGAKEFLEIQQIDGQPYMRLMLPFITDKGCLKCHEQQGYKVGDIRGGISAAIPMKPYLAYEQEMSMNMALSHGTIWLLGLAGLGFSYRRDLRLAQEREKVANELLASEQKYHMVADYTSDWEYWIGVDGKIIYMSPYCKEMTGHDVGEFSGDPGLLPALVHPDDRAAYEAHWRTHSQHAAIGETEFRIVSKDGKIRWINHRCRPVFDQNGNWLGIRAGNRDITARKQMEEALKQSEEKFRVLVEKTQAGIVVHGADTQILLANSTAQRLLGLSEDQLLGKTVVDPAWHFFREDGTVMPLEEYPATQVFASKKPLRNFIVGVHQPDQGSNPWILVNADPVFGEGDELVQVIVTFIDVTERKRAEEALHRSEAQLKEAQHIARIGSWDWDATTDTIVWTEELYRLFDRDPNLPTPNYEEHLKLYVPKSIELLDAAVKRAIKTGEPYALDLELAGTELRRWVTARGEAKRDASGQVVGLRGTAQDITERKQAEESLAQERLFLDTLLDNIAEAVVSCDGQGILSRFNQAARELHGLPERPITPEQWAEYYDLYQADGKTPLRMEEIPLFLALQGERVRDAEMVVIPKGGTARFLLASGQGMRDSGGKLLGAVVTMHDITERKLMEAEIHKLNRNLELRVIERTAELEAANRDMESFSYSISHDLRAPLRAINGFSKILQEDYTDKLDDEGKRLLNVVSDNAEKMGELIDDILAFSRAGRNEIKRSVIDMKKMVADLWEELKPEMAGRSVQLELRDLPSVEGDAVMLRQVWVNLLGNAIKFTQHSANARIEVGGQGGEHETIYHVKDNGVGFDMQYGDKLFGVFQRLHTTKEFEGTGIGLAIVKRIVTKHGGRVWAEGKAGEGATIYFALPVL